MSSGSLVLLSPTNEDEGYFECTAVNDVGEERRVIEVFLQGIDTDFCALHRMLFQMMELMNLPFSPVVPPSIEDDVTTVNAVKMSPVVLPCNVQGHPQPTVTWTKGGAQLSSRGGSYRVLPTGKTTHRRNCHGTTIPQDNIKHLALHDLTMTFVPICLQGCWR